jgi:hypothetical protein
VRTSSEASALWSEEGLIADDELSSAPLSQKRLVTLH